MTAMETTPDLLLARRATASDPRAWEEIVDRYGDRIYNLACRFSCDSAEAEDLTQDVFLKLFSQLRQYRGDVPLLAWALRLSRNLCIDHYRHHRTRLKSETVSDEVLRHHPGGPDPARRAEHRDELRRVERALAALPESLAEVLVLRDLQQLSYDEVAAVVEVPVGTVKSRLNRARRELVDRLAVAEPPRPRRLPPPASWPVAEVPPC